jgi:hypothetical protein
MPKRMKDLDDYCWQCPQSVEPGKFCRCPFPDKFTTANLIKYLRDCIEDMELEGYSIYDEKLKSKEIEKRLLELDEIKKVGYLERR